MKKKYIALFLSLSVAGCAIFSGCTSTSSNDSTAASSESANTLESEDLDSLKGTTFTGRVDSVDGETITLSIEGMGGGAPGGGASPDGTAPEGSTPDVSAPEGSIPGESVLDNSKSNVSSSDNSASNKSAADDSSAKGDSASGETAESGSDSQKASSDKKPGNTADNSSDSGNDTTPPEKPDEPSENDSGSRSDKGSSSNGQHKDDNTPPELPDGEGPNDMASSKTAVLTLKDASILTNNDGSQASLEDIKEGTFLSITLDENGLVTAVSISDGNNMMGPGGAGSSPSGGIESYDAVTEFSEDAVEEGQTYTSDGTDENAIHVSGGNVKLSDSVITRTSDDSTGGDNSSFYGVGAALLVTDGSVSIDQADISTDADGGAGVFAYGDGTAYISDSTIKTEKDTSGGIHVAGGGTLYAWDLDVETNGNSSAAIRSDRGSGTMVVDGGTYTSNGTGSPAVYSTADITVNEADLTANGSEAVCIEGLNTLRLFNCHLTGNMSDDEQNDTTWTVILYQSMSGDSEEGNSSFTMSGGTLTSKNGGLFYTTNTESTFYLSQVDIQSTDDSEFFLQCTGNNNQRGWGSRGSNGADCSFTADNQEMNGNIIWDSISRLDFYMENGSSLRGAFVNDETYAGNGGSGYASLYISSDSQWIVTGNSTLTNLYNEGSIIDSDGKTVSIVGTDGTVYVDGTGSYTITVSNYSTSADFSGASTSDSFDNYAVENPMA